MWENWVSKRRIMKLDPYLSSCTKTIQNGSKTILQDRNLSHVTGKTHQGSGIGKNILKWAPEAQEITRINKKDYIT